MYTHSILVVLAGDHRPLAGTKGKGGCVLCYSFSQPLANLKGNKEMMKLKALLLPMLFLIFSCDTPGEPDCAGISGGDAVEDACGVCEGDGSNCIFDIDGNAYQTIQIGGQLWMAENLKVTHYNDGSEITHIINSDYWGSYVEGQYGVYDNDPSNADIYGNLYNFAAVDDDRGVCPDGWHVPTDAEYTVLTDYLGGTSVAGGKMKETGLDHWNSPNTGATNESGFTGLPAGYRSSTNGAYGNMGNYGYFWSSSEGNSDYAWSRRLYSNYSYVYRYSNYEQNGFSIRCLRD